MSAKKVAARRQGSTGTDSFSGRRGRAAVRRQLAKVREAMKQGHHGPSSHTTLGMSYVLEWMVGQGASPSHYIEFNRQYDNDLENLMLDRKFIQGQIDELRHKAEQPSPSRPVQRPVGAEIEAEAEPRLLEKMWNYRLLRFPNPPST